MKVIVDIIKDLHRATGNGAYHEEFTKTITALMQVTHIFDFSFYPDDECIYFATECINEGVFLLPYDSVFFTWAERNLERDGLSASFLFKGDNTIGALNFIKDPRVDLGDGDNMWLIDSYYHVPMRGHPGFVPHSCAEVFQPKGKAIKGSQEAFGIMDGRSIFMTERLKKATAGVPIHQIHRNEQHYWESVRGLVIALNSKSVGSETVRPSRQVRRAAARAGEWLPTEHRSVSLVLPGATHKSGDRIGTHGSPRMHWRRGHFRRLDDRIIPVSPCIVGTAGNGVITHEYRAKVAATR